jgi:hypothetical protein
VADGGGSIVPAVSALAGRLAEGGRGLQLVELLAARWSFLREPARTITWFELACPAS